MPFDDCQFSGASGDYSVHPPPIAGTHNSRAIGSPGREIVLLWRDEPRLRDYFETILTRYKTDKRILFWDLYNEPSNCIQFIDNQHSKLDPSLEAASYALRETCFAWARAIDSEQPLMVAA